jgi:PPOX class probable F420-dependent enzyme
MPILDPEQPKHVAAQERLRTEPIVWLTTVSAAGQPQTTPVWFLWDGETFLIYSRARAPKLANLRANPRVSLHLEGNGVGGDVVAFEGTAAFDADAPAADRVPAYVAKYAERLASYGWTPEGLARDYPHAIRVTPTRARIW